MGRALVFKASIVLHGSGFGLLVLSLAGGERVSQLRPWSLGALCFGAEVVERCWFGDVETLGRLLSGVADCKLKGKRVGRCF